MVLMRYCDVCGVKVSQEELEQGHGVESDDGRVWCEKHAHLAPAEDKRFPRKRTHITKKKRSSRLRMASISSHHSSGARLGRSGAGRMKSGVRRAPGGVRSGVRHAPGDMESRPVSSNNINIILGICAAVIVVILLVLFVINTDSDGGKGGVKKTPASGTASRLSDRSAASRTPSPKPSRFQSSSTARTENASSPSLLKSRSNDKDGDGMADAWEMVFDLDSNDISDAGKDADGDGACNLYEYLMKTNPRNLKSFPNPGIAVNAKDEEKRVEKTISLGKNEIILNVTIMAFQPDTDLKNRINIKDKLPREDYLHIEGGKVHSRARVFCKWNFASLKEKNVHNVVSATLILMQTQIKNGPFHVLIGVADTDLGALPRYTWNSAQKHGILSGTESYNILKNDVQNMAFRSLDVTNTIKAIVAGDAPNNGIILKMKNEALQAEVSFFSTYHDAGDVSPILKIIYSDKEIVKTPNRVPVIRQPAHGKVNTMTVKAGQPVTFTCDASDPENAGKLSYAWDVSAADGLDFTNAATADFTYPGYKTAGKHLAVVRVSDVNGGRAYATIVVTVK